MAQTGDSIGLIGEPTQLLTWDGRSADLYVSADRLDELMTSFAAKPALYDGLVILVEVQPYDGGDTAKSDDEATAAMAAANALTNRVAPPLCDRLPPLRHPTPTAFSFIVWEQKPGSCPDPGQRTHGPTI